MVILDHVGRLQGFMSDRVVRAHEGQRRLVVEVRSHPADRLMGLG